jgi:hypothetical protein
LRSLGLAHHWQRLLGQGKFNSITEFAAAEQMDLGQASRIYRLVQLVPDLVERAVNSDGEVSFSPLLRGKFTPCWQEQRVALGMQRR